MKSPSDLFLVEEDKKVKLKDLDPGFTGPYKNGEESEEACNEDLDKLFELQAKLYSSDKYALLIILQAMDAAGKDSLIKHVSRGLNAQGCRVSSFKHPSQEEYDHDFFWRYYRALPERGHIGIFNRSHYENVLICKVHPELVVAEKIPGYDSVKKIDKAFWENRYRQINRFEKNLVENGVIILKFFLHISRKEQKERLIARIDDPQKHWKFSFSDINERTYWDDYGKCYEQAIESTSKEHAPWYIIPADKKWYTRSAVTRIIVEKLESLNLKHPALPEEEKEKLDRARKILEDE